MKRAELRREMREKEKNKSTFNMTMEELLKIRRQEFDRAKKILLEKNEELAKEILKMMIVIPTNVLINDYWQKTARKRIPKFVEDCMSLYESWSKGSVDMKELISLAEEYSCIKFGDGSKDVYNAIEKNEKRREI